MKMQKMQCYITAVICFGNRPPGANVSKTFAAVIPEWAKKATVFVPGMLFQLSLIFVVRARRLPKIGTPERCFTYEGVINYNCKKYCNICPCLLVQNEQKSLR